MSNINIQDISNILTDLDYDVLDESLIDTPTRHASYLETFKRKTDKDFTEFCKDNNIKCSAMKSSTMNVIVTLNNISISSMCQHHMLPFYGEVSISYTTNGYTLGLSKFKRIIDFCSKELTTQEELTKKIVNKIQLVLPVKRLHIRLDCVHSCMIIRGIKDLNTKTTTEIHIEETETGILNI